MYNKPPISTAPRLPRLLYTSGSVLTEYARSGNPCWCEDVLGGIGLAIVHHVDASWLDDRKKIKMFWGGTQMLDKHTSGTEERAEETTKERTEEKARERTRTQKRTQEMTPERTCSML